MTALRPGDPVWDTAWTPAAAGWLESVDGEDVWIVNRPAGVDAGDAAMCWSAAPSELRSRLELTSPDDDYCCQCLEATHADGLIRCSTCGHGIHPGCMRLIRSPTPNSGCES
jgi:hypothetical protein